MIHDTSLTIAYHKIVWFCLLSLLCRCFIHFYPSRVQETLGLAPLEQQKTHFVHPQVPYRQSTSLCHEIIVVSLFTVLLYFLINVYIYIRYNTCTCSIFTFVVLFVVFGLHLFYMIGLQVPRSSSAFKRCPRASALRWCQEQPLRGWHWVFVIGGIKWRDFKRYWKIQYMDCRLFVLVVMLLTWWMFRYWVEWCQALLFRILSSFGYTDAFLKTISGIWIALEHGNHMKPLYHVSFRVSVFCW